jgi:hypothetical protein
MAQRDKMDADRLCTVVAGLVDDAEAYRNDRSKDRETAMEYFDGIMNDVPVDEGRSKVVSRDVRSAVKKVLPSVLRTILGNDEIVEYMPVGEGDEDSAEAASDYVNYVALPECHGRQQIEDAINDAIRLRNGIIKWWQENKIEVKASLHTGLGEEEFTQLVAADDVEVIEHTERSEMMEMADPQTGLPMSMPMPVHDVRIKRRTTVSLPRIAAIPGENFLISSDAIRLLEAPLVGEHLKMRRSDLVALGYDRETIDKLTAAPAGTSDQDSEEATRRRDVYQHNDATTKAMEELDYYELLVRVDYDDDGIAELRRLVFAGGLKKENLLENDDWDEVNYADIVSERRPHQWEGNSVTDDVKEIQKIKTVLLRQTMDNLYWQNNLQPIVQEGVVQNPSSVTNPRFGEPIIVGQGVDVRAAVGYNQVPLVADKSFAMLSYLDEEMTDRTGISDASSGMAPDALQNMTAKASAMVEQAGIGQTEMMVRCIAESLKPVFRGLLKLVIQHQDKPRTVRLRDEWVTFDPRTWNADMDAVVNVGLGAGTRERDMMMMQQVIGLQEKILASMGPVVGQQFVSVDNVYNGMSKLVEAAGLKSVGLYFTKPDPAAIQQAMEAQSQQPSPDQVKADAALALEDKRTQGKMAVEAFKSQQKVTELRAKLEADAGKERAQMDADLVTTLQQIEAEARSRMEEALFNAQSADKDRQLDRERIVVDATLTHEEIASRERIAAAGREASIQQAQASSIGRALERNERAGQ